MWMNIESKLWKVTSFNDAYASVFQKASGKWRLVKRSAFPSVEALAQMSEGRFDAFCRDAFHDAGYQGTARMAWER